ncbi:MAG: hypothetical protein R2774_02635 [Saprospiraceae bacterium]
MKLKIHLLLFGILLFSFIQGQISDLEGLSSGELRTFIDLKDNEKNFYGYLVIYAIDNNTDHETKFEYFVFDKNLKHIVSNHIITSNEVETFEGFLNVKNELILNPVSKANVKKQFTSANDQNAWKIDLATNTTMPYHKLCFVNDTIVECNYVGTSKELKKEKKRLGFNLKSNVISLKEGGYLVIQFDDYGHYFNNYTWIKFDDNKKELWRTTLNEVSNKKNSYVVLPVDVDSTKIYSFQIYTHHRTGDPKSLAIITLDLESGGIIKKIDLDSKKSIQSTEILDMSHLSLIKHIKNGIFSIKPFQTFDDKLVFIGDIIEKMNSPKGYFRMIFNKKTHSIKFDDLYTDKDIKRYIIENKINGYNDNYRLALLKSHFLKDGSMVLVFRKIKNSGSTVYLSEDLIFVFTDKNYNILHIQTLPEEVKGYNIYDNLYTKNINDDTDFYYAYTYPVQTDNGKYNHTVFVNMWINGKYKMDKFSFSSNYNTLLFLPAKEEYLMLREFDSVKNLNLIRLEKLNF